MVGARSAVFVWLESTTMRLAWDAAIKRRWRPRGRSLRNVVVTTTWLRWRMLIYRRSLRDATSTTLLMMRRQLCCRLWRTFRNAASTIRRWWGRLAFSSDVGEDGGRSEAPPGSRWEGPPEEDDCCLPRPRAWNSRRSASCWGPRPAWRQPCMRRQYSTSSGFMGKYRYSVSWSGPKRRMETFRWLCKHIHCTPRRCSCTPLGVDHIAQPRVFLCTLVYGCINYTPYNGCTFTPCLVLFYTIFILLSIQPRGVGLHPCLGSAPRCGSSPQNLGALVNPVPPFKPCFPSPRSRTL